MPSFRSVMTLEDGTGHGNEPTRVTFYFPSFDVGTGRIDAAFPLPMTDEALGQYFVDREECERALSREAYDWRVAAAHAEMADRYEALAAVFGAKRLTQIPIDYI